MCVITHTILGILYVFVHLMPGNALFSVHLLLAGHQFIWLSPSTYNRLLNKTHFSLRSMAVLALSEAKKALPSATKSENPNNQYPGYRLLGFHPSCRVLLPRYRVYQLKNPQKSCPTTIPKNKVFTPMPVGNPTRQLKIGKFHPYPPLTTLERPPKN